MISLEETRKMIIDIAKENDIPIFEFLTFVISRDDGTPCIQIEGNTYYYLARDRSTNTFEKRIQEINELMYWVFCDITFEMAKRYELKNRQKDFDHRRLLFSYQLKLLDRMDTEWARIRREVINNTLVRNPYIDKSVSK